MSTIELVKVNPQEYGLTSETAKNIQDQFSPMLEKMVALEDEFNKITSLDIEDKSTSMLAKELRLKYVKVRTATAEIHKQQKAFYLNGGRFVDGWKNAQLFASQGKEEALEKIEKYFENKEKERLENIQNERLKLIVPYVNDLTGIQLGTMQDDVFDAYLSAKKKEHEDRMEAIKQAEINRLEALRIEAEQREAQRIENEKLKAEIEAKQKEIEAERLANEQKLAEQRAIAKQEADKIEAENKAKLKAEIEAKAKIEAELKAKKDAEIEAEKTRVALELQAKKEAEKLAKAPIKKQLLAWIDTFSINEISLQNEKKDLIVEKFEAFKNWAKKEVETI